MKSLILTFSIICTLCSNAQSIIEWQVVPQSTGSGNSGRDVTVDKYGNSYVVGSFSSTLDLDEGLGVYELVAEDVGNVFIAKYDPAGQIIWGQTFGGNQYYGLDGGVSVNSIDIDSNLNVFLVGSFTGDVDFATGPDTAVVYTPNFHQSDVFILKLDSAGQFLWVKTIGTQSFKEIAHSVDVDVFGNILLTGRFGNDTDFDPGVGTHLILNSGLNAIGDQSTFLLKLDNDGNFLWVQAFGDEATDDARNIRAVTSDQVGNIYLTAPFFGDVPFNYNENQNIISASTTDNYQSDIFLLKLTNDGNFIWVKTWSSTNMIRASNVAVDNSGVVAIIADFKGSVDVDPSTNSIIKSSTDIGQTTISALIVQLNENGDYLWANSLDVETHGHTRPEGITYTPYGTVAFSGAFYGIVDFDPSLGDSTIESTQFEAPYGQTSDFYIVHFDHYGNFLWTKTFDSGTWGTINTSSLSCDADGHIYSISMDAYNFDLKKISNCPAGELVLTTPVLPDIITDCPIWNLAAPTALHECFGVVQATHNITFPINNLDTTEVIWTYQHFTGSDTSQIQYVVLTQLDTIPPIPNLITLPDIISECPVSPITPSASDYCSGIISATTDVNFPIFQYDTTIVVWTFEDYNGNIISQNQNVIIIPMIDSIYFNNGSLNYDYSGYTYQWLDCDNAMALVPGQTNNTFILSEDGNYALSVSNGNCEIITNCVEINGLSLENNHDEIRLSIYPNPAHEQIRLNKICTTVKIYNMQGALLIHENNVDQIGLQSLSNGIYLITADSLNQILVKQ